jgi:hypothetical protein
MKPPSSSMSASLRGQSPKGRTNETPRVGRQSPPNEAGARIPGEMKVQNPPGTPPVGTVKPYAGAVGKTFGGGE